MKYSVQKGKLIDLMGTRGITRQMMADILNITYASVLRKIDGASEFTQSEIKALKDNFKLSPEEVVSIFFEN